MSDARETPVANLDLVRATRDDILKLWLHCLRKCGQRGHIYPERTRNNEWLIGGPENFLHQLDAYAKKLGAKSDRRNVKPATNLVIGASPEYFRPAFNRDDPEGFGKYDPERTRAWAEAVKDWLRKEFGDDCLAAHLHVDERTVHIHAFIIPTARKMPRVPRRPRKGETPEQFEKRVAKAKRRKPRTVLSHHQHRLFGAGRMSYEAIVDSYAEAVSHLGIERAARGVDATPTTKAAWARELLRKAETREREASETVASIRRQRRVEDEAFEYGSTCVVEEKIAYRPASDEKPEAGLKWGPQAPVEERERKAIIQRIRPAKDRVLQFARFMHRLTQGASKKAQDTIIRAAGALMRRKADLDVRERELAERERALCGMQVLEDATLDDGRLKPEDARKIKSLTEAPSRPPPPRPLAIRREVIRTASR